MFPWTALVPPHCYAENKTPVSVDPSEIGVPSFSDALSPATDKEIRHAMESQTNLQNETVRYENGEARSSLGTLNAEPLTINMN